MLATLQPAAVQRAQGASGSSGSQAATVGGAGPGLAALALRTSMRNQFPCQVSSLASSGGRVRVGLALAGGQVLFARITRESAQLLALAREQQVLALCKATAVRVAAQLSTTDGCNVMAGTVQRVSRAALGGEVSLLLAGGVSLVGFADAGHGLKTGRPAQASVEESGVVIAVWG